MPTTGEDIVTWRCGCARCLRVAMTFVAEMDSNKRYVCGWQRKAATQLQAPVERTAQAVPAELGFWPLHTSQSKPHITHAASSSSCCGIPHCVQKHLWQFKSQQKERTCLDGACLHSSKTRRPCCSCAAAHLRHVGIVCISRCSKYPAAAISDRLRIEGFVSRLSMCLQRSDCAEFETMSGCQRSL